MEKLIENIGIKGPPAIQALAVFALFVIAAKALDMFVDKALRRMARKTMSDLDDLIVERLHKPVFYTIALAGGAEAIKLLLHKGRLLFYISGGLYSVIVVLWGITVVRISNIAIEDALKKASDTTGLGREVVPLVENVLKVVVAGISLMVILSIWKVNITPIFASAGIAGAAVAFAAKDTIANFFGGISIFIDKPYKIGDFIVLERGERGEVVEIGIRSTRIKTLEGAIISVPNSIIAGTMVTNESAPAPPLRVKVPVSVSYGSDIDRVEDLITGIAGGVQNVIAEPMPVLRFREMGESGLNLELLCWVKEPSLKELTLHELNKALYKGLTQAGIKIPFPQRELHIYKESEGDGS